MLINITSHISSLYCSLHSHYFSPFFSPFSSCSPYFHLSLHFVALFLPKTIFRLLSNSDDRAHTHTHTVFFFIWWWFLVYLNFLLVLFLLNLSLFSWAICLFTRSHLHSLTPSNNAIFSLFLFSTLFSFNTNLPNNTNLTINNYLFCSFGLTHTHTFK